MTGRFEQTNPKPISAILALVLLAAVLFTAGCSGDDGGDSGQGGDPALSEEARPELREHLRERAGQNALAPDEQAAKESVEEIYGVLGQRGRSGGSQNDGGGGGADRRGSAGIDAAAFCDLMSREAVEQTIEYARRSSGIDREWDCESAVEILVLRSKRAGGLEQAQRARVVGVNIEGDRATATIRVGRGPLSTVPMVREDGEWKLGEALGGG